MIWRNWPQKESSKSQKKKQEHIHDHSWQNIPNSDEGSLWAMPRSSDGSGSAGFEGTSRSKGASSTSSSRGSRGLFSESCDLPWGESSRLSWRLEALKSMQIEQSHTLGQRNTLAYTIAMFQFDHYAVLKYRIHPSATFPVCALVEFSPRQSWIC